MALYKLIGLNPAYVKRGGRLLEEERPVEGQIEMPVPSLTITSNRNQQYTSS